MGNIQVSLLWVSPSKFFNWEGKTKLLSWNDELITKQTLNLMWDVVCVLCVSGVTVSSDSTMMSLRWKFTHSSYQTSSEGSGGTRTGVLRAAREDNKSCRRSSAWGPEQQSKQCVWNSWWERGGGRKWMNWLEKDQERCVLRVTLVKDSKKDSKGMKVYMTEGWTDSTLWTVSVKSVFTWDGRCPKLRTTESKVSYVKVVLQTDQHSRLSQ